MYLVRIWGGGFLAPPITTRIHVTCVCMGGSGIKLVYFSMGGYTTFWYHPYPWGGGDTTTFRQSVKNTVLTVLTVKCQSVKRGGDTTNHF